MQPVLHDPRADFDRAVRERGGMLVSGPGSFAYLSWPLGTNVEIVLEDFLRKACMVHPDVLHNEKERKKASGNPLHGGYVPQLIPYSDVFMACHEAWRGPKPTGGFEDFVMLCRTYAQAVKNTKYDTGVEVTCGSSAINVFDHAHEKMRRKRALKALHDAQAQPWLSVGSPAK